MANVNQFSFDDPVAASQVKRQQAIAEMLRQQSQQPIETNQMAGGYVVPVSPLQNLSKIAQTLMAQYAQKNADKAQETYQTQQRETLGRDTQAIIQALQGTPEQPFQADTFDDTDNPFGAMTQSAVAPDRNKAIALALQSQNPGLQNVGGSMLAKVLEGRDVDYNKPFLPDGRPNAAYQDYERSKQKTRASPASVAEYEFAKSQGYQGTFEQWRNAAAKSTTPYSVPVQTARGVMSYDTRTGRMTPATVDGLPVVGSSSDPVLQGRIASSKKEGSEIGEQKSMIVGKENAVNAVRKAKTYLTDGIYAGAWGPLTKEAVKRVPGLDKTKAARTEAFIAEIGESVVPRLKEFGGNDSNEELKYLQRIMAGDISMEPEALAKILDSAEKKIQIGIDRLNQDGQPRLGNNVVGEFVGDPVKIQKDIDLMMDPKMRALAQKALDEQLAKAKQPKTTGGWSIQKVK